MRAVFIDLQGTLGGDPLGHVGDFQFYPFAIDAIKLLNENNILAIVLTNQSRIAKGDLTLDEYNQKIMNIREELNKQGAYLDEIYCCPHSRDDKCECKKPLIGMAKEAESEFNIDLEKSYVIGDMGMSDMLLASAIDAKGILVLTGVGQGSLNEFRNTWKDAEPAYVADNVLEAVKWIIEDIK
ncbi:D-glycero-alpha-D-manno-heptose-1,7-bisphosphate 7-phosphatase [Oceanirhabdus sp. W0125-5]|uniref:D-glycero-alpha-D-manno-heptose-1,7-bisphosphate 7-phosphatase n=1 Tax=Oceanirhabdus sp. W0125-5 TaxID=2999116 RepID=UPI0022F32A57|nr:HAD-IIIA family hydrolase [Oceanirhabdus sp. W0125-5]WBW99514.1 HAD-IIIA family hydrolase [Oceanirhabdus sp. W0125-5]